MRFLVLYPKLVSDRPWVPWMPSFMRQRDWINQSLLFTLLVSCFEMGIERANLEDEVGSLSRSSLRVDKLFTMVASLLGLIAEISKKVLVWSLGWCHTMLLLVQFPKLVSDQS